MVERLCLSSTTKRVAVYKASLLVSVCKEMQGRPRIGRVAVCFEMLMASLTADSDVRCGEQLHLRN